MSYVRADRAATVQVESGSMWGATVRVTVAQRAGPSSTNSSGTVPYVPAPVTSPAPVLMSPVYSEPSTKR
jgi:hypothetical protein